MQHRAAIQTWGGLTPPSSLGKLRGNAGEKEGRVSDGTGGLGRGGEADAASCPATNFILQELPRACSPARGTTAAPVPSFGDGGEEERKKPHNVIAILKRNGRQE